MNERGSIIIIINKLGFQGINNKTIKNKIKYEFEEEIWKKKHKKTLRF